MEYYRNCITSTNWYNAIRGDQSEPGYNLIKVLINSGFTMMTYGGKAGFYKFCDKTTDDFTHIKGEILLSPESNRNWYTYLWGNFTKQGYYYTDTPFFEARYYNYYITPPSKRPNVDFVFFLLKNGGYFFHLSATSVSDPFPQIKIKNTQPNTDLTWAEKEANSSYYEKTSVQRLNYTLIGIPHVTDSIIDRPCLMFFANHLAEDNTITFINDIDYNNWPNKSGETAITYLDDKMEHFDYQPNICTLVKYPLEDGYIGNLYLMATSPVNKVTEDGMFFSIGNRNFFNIYGNLVVELPADKEDYQWQLR